MLLRTATVKQRDHSRIAAYLYRIPMPVNKVRLFADGNSYPICPRCTNTVEREYMHFCSRCGQKLAWHLLDIAGIIYASGQKGSI